MKKGVIGIIEVVVIVLIIAAAGFVWWRISDTNKTIIKEQEISDSLDKWTKYSSKKDGLSFSYPSNWEYFDSNALKEFRSPDFKMTGVQLPVIVEGERIYYRVEDMVIKDLTVNNYLRSDSYRSLNNPENNRIEKYGEYKGFRYDQYSDNWNSTTAIFFPDSGKRIFFYYQIPPDKDYFDMFLFNQILETVELK